MKVLVALDDSHCSKAAFDSVKARCWPKDTEFMLVSVVPQKKGNYGYLQSNQMMSGLDHLSKKSMNECQHMLAHKAEELVGVWQEYRVLIDVRVGHVIEELFAAVQCYKPDVIIMGSHGRRAAKLHALGSVAEAVVQYAPCSVEIVKIRDSASYLFSSQPKVLICYDGSAHCVSAVDWVAQASWAPDQKFCLLSVIAPLEDLIPDLDPAQQNVFASTKAKILRQAEHSLESCAQRLGRNIAADQIQTMVCEGYAVDVIAQVAREWGADLLVLGAHTKAAKEDPHIGSVAKRLVGSVGCSIKIVRAACDAETPETRSMVPAQRDALSTGQMTVGAHTMPRIWTARDDGLYS